MTTTATSDPKRRALGKGLDSLLPRTHPPAPTPAAAAPGPPSPDTESGKPREIALDQIEPNPYQTRSRVEESELGELAASIAANGVIQPILVRPQADGRFQLIAGERRWRASKVAGKAAVPAIVRRVSDEQAMEITIVENLQRSDLNPIEQARAFNRLSTDFHMTQEQIALRTGKDRAQIGNYIRLLRLPGTVQGMVESGELSFGHAKALLALQHSPGLEKTAQRVCALSLSVRQTESLVQNLLAPDRPPKEPKPEPVVDPNVKEVAERLQRALGLKVRIEDNRGRGRVIIEYGDLADFDGLLEKLGTEGR
jgi:ParB family transcriptional regulator, chromosome partitioning protein